MQVTHLPEALFMVEVAGEVEVVGLPAAEVRQKTAILAQIAQVRITIPATEGRRVITNNPETQNLVAAREPHLGIAALEGLMEEVRYTEARGEAAAGQ